MRQGLIERARRMERSIIETARARGKDVPRPCPSEVCEDFATTVERTGLDPLANHVRVLYLKTWAVYVTIDGLRAIAEDTHKYAPGTATWESDKDGHVVSATYRCHKMAGPPGREQWMETSATAFMSEYASGTPVWREKPRVMLAKVAEALCLRRAFPRELGGLYAPEEMRDTIEHTDTPAPAPSALPAPEGPAFDVFDALASGRDTSGLPEAQRRFIRDVTEDQWARIAKQPGGAAKLQAIMDALHGCPEVRG